MTIAHDSVGSGTGTTTLTWEHTVSGTVRGIVVFIFQNTGTTVSCTAVDCEGQAMALVGEANDTAGEPGGVQGWLLGESIPAGNLTITATVSGTADKYGLSIAVTADGDIELAGTTGFAVAEENQANPSVTVTGITGPSYGFGAVHSGLNAPGNITAGSGFTIRGTNDYGNQSAAGESSNSEQASGDHTINFTILSDDVGMIGIAVQEVAGSAPANASIDSDLPALTQAITAEVLLEAAIDSGLPALTQALTAKVLLEAAIAQTLPALTQAVTATVGAVAEAAIAQTLPALTQSATAEAVIEAIITATLPALTQGATAEAILEAAIAQTLPAMSQGATVDVVVEAVLAQALPALIQSATAQAVEAAEASVAQTLPALTQAMTVALGALGALDAVVSTTLPALDARARVVFGGGGKEGYVVWRYSPNPRRTRRKLPFRGGIYR